MELTFTKMHGLGNDFIIIDDRDETLDLSEDAVRWFCDRNFGIGSDGLILLRPAVSEGSDCAWWFRNSDGSVAEMCGNGIRCVAKYVVDSGVVQPDSQYVRVDTAMGPYAISVNRGPDGLMESATVDMGEPIFEPRRVPTGLACEDSEDPVVECPIETELGTFSVTALSMGNPHCVIFVEDVDEAPVETVGPLLEAHSAFPAKTNVEFAQMLDDGTMLLRVWERGVGETLACGTGACAAAVAAILTCRAGRELVVELPGGELLIRWGEDGHVYMTGPATRVFDGTISIPQDDG